MSKVLIIGSNYYDFITSVSSAFTSLGWETVTETYELPVHPFKGILKWKHKLSIHKQALIEQNRIDYSHYLFNQFNTHKPDLVFIMNGGILTDQVLINMKSQCKVVIWMYDTIKRYPQCINHIDCVDKFFCFEQSDLEYYNKIGKNAFFLPQACDTDIYHPIICNQKDIDILFVGTLYKYQKRIDLLKAVIAAFPDKRIMIYGIYKPWYKGLLKCLFRERRDIFMNHNVSTKEANILYNKAKVVINIHHETQLFGANPKVFEICGSGAYQICDANPYISSLFPNNEVGLYRNKEELLHQIAFALEPSHANICQKKALEAREIIVNRHTYLNRIATVLEKTGFTVSQTTNHPTA